MTVKFVSTICPYCGCGCGMNLVVKDEKVVGVEPWKRHPVNEGKLCPKGNFTHEFIHRDDRLTTPLIKKDGKFVPATWDEALTLIASKFKDIKAKFGPDAMACFSSARVTNEENYVMQKFARVALESANIDHCARLCHGTTVAGLAKSLGSGAMTNSIKDIEEAKTIFIIGSNTLEDHPLIGRRVVRAVEKGATLINIDPRFTMTAKQATIYAPFFSGTDVALINAMMNVIITEGLEDKEFIKTRTRDYEKMKEEVLKCTPEWAAPITGVPAETIRKVARIYATNKPSAIIYSMGVTQHACGTENVLSMSNIAMLTGNIGKRGSGVNPLRGQNNVQGACDMGALPNVYSGYQNVTLEPMIQKMKDAWGCDVAGGKVGYTVTDMINVLCDSPPKLKAIYIMGENPMVSDPDLGHVEHALKNLEFLVVQDIFLTETAQLANVVLPAACYAEKDGTQTSTERRVQRFRKAVEPPGEAKADWQIICELAAKMGCAKQFPFKSPEEVFNEVAKVTPSYAGMSYKRLEKPEALHWPCPDASHPGTPILHTVKFAHPDGLGIFTPIEFKRPAENPDAEFPMILTTGRCIWHWHTGSMTRRSASLEREEPQSWIEINTEDAKRLGIQDKELVKAITRRGELKVTARVTDGIKKNEVFMPFHYAECAANKLTHNALDPVAKIPEFKACAIRVEKIKEA